ncbi:helix-turn-helix domain-containing protein, partial [Acidiphilium sp.]|uniref:helix-turn-helix domain-containing protein n=1 Tax=Acidiphilium sp. TaxID=527 RepID=UPI0033900FFC
MPWKACSVMDERVRFIARLLEGESMSELCREAGISRKTGYKILNRYKEEGLTAISDRSRRPCRYANQMPPQLEAMKEQAALGRPQAARAPAAPAAQRHQATGRQHHSRRARPQWACQPSGPPPPPRPGHPAFRRGGAQRSLVCRFQRRVQARQRPVLLPAHRHRPRL